jgi:hypothetical protein
MSVTLINVNRPKNKRAIKIDDIIGKDALQEAKLQEAKLQGTKFQKENEEVDAVDILKRLHRGKN